MEINHIASGSSGNAIVVDDGHSQIMLDAGLSYSKLARHVTLSELAGVFITHAHADHCKAVPELSRRGAELFISQGAAAEIGNNTEQTIFCNYLQHTRQVEVGSWVVLPFAVVHDTPEPMGFLFQSRETGKKGIYISDSAYIAYDFPGVTHFLIEANYSNELLGDSDDPDWLKDRIRRSHFSLDDLITFFDTSDMSAAEEIHLLHMSDRNSDEAAFKDKLQRRYGIPVFSISDNSNKEVA